MFIPGFDMHSVFSSDLADAKRLIEIIGLYKYILLSQVLSILLPALIFLMIFHGNNMFEYIKINMPSKYSFFFYSLMLLFLAYPLIQFSYAINSKLDFGGWFERESMLIDDIMMRIMHIDNVYDFVVKIVLVALLPAVSEELFFRAGVQNELVKGMKNKDIAIITAAILFSLLHMQFDGFLPRFFLGLILGYVYFWSQSILVSISIHFVNNALLIVAAFLQQDKIEQLINEQNSDIIPLHILLMSIVAVFVLRHRLYNMWKDINNPQIEEKEKMKV